MDGLQPLLDIFSLEAVAIAQAIGVVIFLTQGIKDDLPWFAGEKTKILVAAISLGASLVFFAAGGAKAILVGWIAVYLGSKATKNLFNKVTKKG